MFEQSVIDTAGRRSGALAASVSAQTILVGILILIPLIYSDRLPLIQPTTPLTLPLSPPPPPPEQVETTSTATETPASLSVVRVFRVPTRSPSAPDSASVPIAIDAPPSWGDYAGVSIAVPASTGITLPRMLIAPPPAAPIVAKPPDRPHPVGGDVQAAKLIRKVMPVYPPLAQQARISGTVRLRGIIAKDGTIRQLQLIEGSPLLVRAAMDAVRQWIYRPTLLNGEPVEVVAPIDVIFTLSQ